MALTVGVATVLESREVVVVVTGLRKSFALSKAIGGSFVSEFKVMLLVVLTVLRQREALIIW